MVAWSRLETDLRVPVDMELREGTDGDGAHKSSCGCPPISRHLSAPNTLQGGSHSKGCCGGKISQLTTNAKATTLDTTTCTIFSMDG